MLKSFTGTSVAEVIKEVNVFLSEYPTAYVAKMVGVATTMNVIKYTLIVYYEPNEEFISISKQEYEELQEQAWKYKELCK